MIDEVLEDETGTANVVVWLATAQAQQQAFLTAQILQEDGISAAN